MKIEFGDIIIPSINSLNDKLKTVRNKYMLVVRGSQILLRARLQRHPAEADKINALLNIKDLDVQLEPVSDEIDNKDAFREVTQLMHELLTKGKNKEQTESPSAENYAHLPSAGVRKAKQNMLDASVQRFKVEACMNIDQKADASGKLVYLNDQHKHDFEVTYLEHNLIVFYHMDTMKLNEYVDQNRMAFRIKKCLSPEVQQFNTLLDEKSALFLQKLFEDKSLGYAKSQIMRMLEKHYKKDPKKVEHEICELYQKSINHSANIKQDEINRFAKIVAQQHSVVLNMIDYIEKNSNEKNDFRQKLNSSMASSASPTLSQIRKQLSLIEALKQEVQPVYESVDKAVLMQEALKAADSPILKSHVKDDSQTNVLINKASAKKKEKSKKPATSEQELSGENLESILDEIKRQYGPLKPQEKFKSLANKYRPVLKSLAFNKNTIKHKIPANRDDLLYVSYMLSLLTAAKTNKGIEEAIFEFGDLYRNTVRDLKKGSDVNEQKTKIKVELNSFNSSLKTEDIHLKAIHEFMVLCFNSPASILEKNSLKKAVSCVRNFRESKEPKLDLMIRSILNLINDKDDTLFAFRLTFDQALLSDMNDIFDGDSKGLKKIHHLHVLLSLYFDVCLGTCIDEDSRYQENNFYETLAKEIVNHINYKESISEQFTHHFISRTVVTLVSRIEALDDHCYESLLSYAGVNVVKRIFKRNEALAEPFLIARVMESFSHLSIYLKSMYTIISTTVPTIFHQEPLYSLNCNDRCSFLPGTSSEHVIKLAEKALNLLISIKDNKGLHLEDDVIKHHDMAIICVQLLIKNPELALGEKYNEKFSNILRNSSDFMSLAKLISTRMESFVCKYGASADDLVDKVVDYISIEKDFTSIKSIMRAPDKAKISRNAISKLTLLSQMLNKKLQEKTLEINSMNKEIAKLSSAVEVSPYTSMTSAETAAISDLVMHLSSIHKVISFSRVIDSQSFISQCTILVEVIHQARESKSVLDVFNNLNKDFIKCTNDYKHMVDGVSLGSDKAPLYEVFYKKVTHALPQKIAGDTGLIAFIIILSKLHYLPDGSNKGEHLVKINEFYKEYRDSLTPSLETLARKVMRYVIEYNLLPEDSPFDASRKFIHTIALCDVHQLMNEDMYQVDTLVDIETGLKLACQARSEKTFEKDKFGLLDGELSRLLFSEILKDDNQKNKLSLICRKKFFEISTRVLMIVSTPLICVKAMNSALEHVLQTTIKTYDYQSDEEFRSLSFMALNVGEYEYFYTVLMLCIPKINPGSSIPFKFSSQIPSHKTPAEVLHVEQSQKTTDFLREKITVIMVNIIDIKNMNDKAQNEILDINLDVAYICLGLLYKNINLIYELNFNENFYSQIVCNEELSQKFKLLCSLNNLTVINASEPQRTPICTMYRLDSSHQNANSDSKHCEISESNIKHKQDL